MSQSCQANWTCLRTGTARLQRRQQCKSSFTQRTMICQMTSRYADAPQPAFICLALTCGAELSALVGVARALDCMVVSSDADLGSLGGAAGASAVGNVGGWTCCADVLHLLKGAGRVSGSACGQPGRSLPAIVSWGVLLHHPQGRTFWA